VNVSSVTVATSANLAAYAASKGGLLALKRAIAIEFALITSAPTLSCRVAVDPPMLRAGLGRGHVGGGDILERLDNLARKDCQRAGRSSDEIAHAIYFLADDTQSSFMTGQAMIIDAVPPARLRTE